MKKHPWRWPFLWLLILAWPAALSAAPGAMGRRVLFEGDSAKSWSAAECTIESSTARTRTGKATWHWHVMVDYFAGEPNYPVGWPRVSHSVGAGAGRDWSGWDFLQMWIYSDTSRATLPKEPAGLTLQIPDSHSTYERPLSELKKGEWVEIKIPLAQLPRKDDARLIQFHISESNYRHQDELDFYIDDLALLRYAEPTLLEFAAESAVMFADAKGVPVRFNLAGVKPDAPVEIACEMRHGGRVAARAAVNATRGPQRVVLDLERQRVEPGEYELVARATGSEQTATARVRLVESPWR